MKMKLFYEKHPWVRFPVGDGINKLILGSFPPNKMVIPLGTTVKYEDNNEFVFSLKNKTVNNVDFFYGSKENKFWDLFMYSFNLKFNLQVDLDKLKHWLIKNNWGISDIVLETTRKCDSPKDSDLVPLKWNK